MRIVKSLYRYHPLWAGWIYREVSFSYTASSLYSLQAGGFGRVSPRTQDKQVNIRLDDATIAALDECRAAQRNQRGNIPNRSDVVREAIDEYLKRRDKVPQN